MQSLDQQMKGQGGNTTQYIVLGLYFDQEVVYER